MRWILLATLALLCGCQTTQTLEIARYMTHPGQYGTVGLVVNDGFVYSDGSYVSTTHLSVRHELTNSGLFNEVRLNSPFLPRQIRAHVQGSSTDSAGADMAKLMFNAATLFLVPTSRSMKYTATFVVECRGQVIGEFSYEQMIKSTSFIGIDPTSNERNVIESVVSKLLRDLESEAGQGLRDCPEQSDWRTN